MANLVEAIEWEPAIYQLEETDTALGGVGGTLNVQPGQLANRTAWLKSMRGVKDGILGVNANKTGLAAELNNVIEILAKVTYTLPTTGIQTGTKVHIVASLNSAITYGTINVESGSLLNGYSSVTSLYLYNGEKVTLVKDASAWKVISYSGNLFNAGEELRGRKIYNNTLVMDGTTKNRTDYPRLFAYINTLGGSGVTTEANWLSSISYQGFFTLGDGTSTFRLPDERGLFERAMDLGRGLDLSRYVNTDQAGNYEADNVKSHSHSFRDWYYPGAAPDIYGAPYYEPTAGYNANRGPGDSDNDNIYVMYKDKTTGSTGGAETIVKNVAKLPLIRY